jgi:hypothetical protein
MYEGEADYVPYFWEHKQPVQTVGKVRIYLVQDETSQFDDLMGRSQLNLAECSNGKVTEIV